MTEDMYIEIREMINTVGDTAAYLAQLQEADYGNVIESWTQNLGIIIENVNSLILDSNKVTFCDPEYLASHFMEYRYQRDLMNQYMQWHDRMLEVLERQYYSKNIWERKFVRLMDYVHYVDKELIIEKAKNSLLGIDRAVIQKLCAYYQEYAGFWGTLDVDHQRYDVIINRVETLIEHRDEFLWLHDLLADQRSKMVLTGMLYNWVTFDFDYIKTIKEANYTDYFDLDLVECDEREVWVDLGAWIGDSTQNYINTYGKYQRIYCYEIDESSMEEMKKNLGRYSNIVYCNKGAGAENCKKYFVKSADTSSNRIVDSPTEKEVEIVRLDDDIQEKVTMIKMDIEGSEQKALAGCIRHIQEESPKLLICVYHNNEDIYRIPQMIMEMNPRYRLYLRSNGMQWGPAEIVLLAIPI